MKIDDVVSVIYGAESLGTGVVVRVQDVPGGEPSLDVLCARTVPGGDTNPHVFRDVQHYSRDPLGAVRWAMWEGHPPAPVGEADPGSGTGPWDPLLGGVVEGSQVSTQRPE